MYQRKRNPSAVVNKTLAFLFVYVIVIMVVGSILVLMGLPLKDSFFVALSAISNTGLGTDITGLGGNFSLIPAGGKWLLSFVMLVGRLGIHHPPSLLPRFLEKIDNYTSTS